MRHHHPQIAARLVARAAQVGLHLMPLRDQLARVLEAAPAVLGELHAVRRALQQLDAEQTLERLQTSAHRRLAGAELLRRRRQAARLHDAHKAGEELDAIRAGWLSV